MIKFIEKLFGICFHDWGNWEMDMRGVQRRSCKKCNRKQTVIG